MPIYEYKCERCGEQFEKIERFSDEPLSVHEKCGGPVHRLVSAPSFQFKGTGWYVTDYGRKGNSGGNGSSKTEGGKSESKGESNSGSSSESGSASESKSESKKESSKGESKGDSKSPSSGT